MSLHNGRSPEHARKQVERRALPLQMGWGYVPFFCRTRVYPRGTYARPSQQPSVNFVHRVHVQAKLAKPQTWLPLSPQKEEASKEGKNTCANHSFVSQRHNGHGVCGIDCRVLLFSFGWTMHKWRQRRVPRYVSVCARVPTKADGA